MTLQPIPVSEEWVPGQHYQLEFNVREKLPLPNFTVEGRVNELVRRVANDPRVKLLRYQYKPADSVLTMQVEAKSSASPILIIVAGIIAIGVLVALTIVLKQVARILGVQSAEELVARKELLETLDPVNRFAEGLRGNLVGTLVPLGILAGAGFFIFRMVRR